MSILALYPRIVHSKICSKHERIFTALSSTFEPAFNSPSRSQIVQEIQKRYENLRIKKRSGGMKKEILTQIESIAAQRHLTQDADRFARICEKNKKRFPRYLGTELNRDAQSRKSIVFPLAAQQDSSLFTKSRTEKIATEQANKCAESEIDRGFFLSNDNYRDDYHAATAADIPEEDMTEPTLQYYGDLEDAVEDIEFQLPGQETVPKDGANALRNEKVDIGDWASDYVTSEGTTEELAKFKELKEAKCAGCGAQFHCHNPSLPGFVPLEMFKDIEKNTKKIPFYQKTDYICRRCYLLKEYNFLLNLNVCEVDYSAIMGHLKLVQEALILLIVDMTDLECSIHSELAQIIGPNKPMFVIGNKVDLLPPDTRQGYLHHYRDCLRRAVSDAGITANFNVLKYMLVSAKTGFGIEDLITSIYQNWIGPRGVLRNDVYVVGSTNAGKSTLFNTFIQSDLCKVRAMDLVERVTTSIWPGTTLSLLKFPLMNPTPQRLEMRRRRLISMQAWAKKEEQMRRSLFRKTNDPKYITMHGIVRNTFKEREEELQPVSTEKLLKQFNGELVPGDELEELDGKKGKGMSLNDRVFQRGHWCYDTPGTVNNGQILNLLTLEELINVIPRSIIIPRVFIIFPGQCMVIGAIACIKVIQSSTISKDAVPIYMTVFVSQNLSVNVVPTKNFDDYLQKHRTDPTLGAPLGDNHRMENFPKLEGREMEIPGGRDMRDGGLADVVLSSIGWALVTTNAESVKVEASTPAGRGIFLRQPPLIPYAADYREKRIKQTAEYTTRSLNDTDAFGALQNGGRMRRNIGQRNYGVDSSENEIYANFDLV